jgi:hypothetical protein
MDNKVNPIDGDQGKPIVFQHAYDLTRWYADRVAGFPKPHRFTLGDRIQDALFDLLAVLQDAAYGKRRGESLDKAQDLVDRLRLWNRLARDLRCVSPKQYACAAEKIEGIGRQVGGWSRSPSGRKPPAPTTDGTTRPVPSRRELEQRSNRLPLRVSEHEPTVEPKHEQRLPGCVAQDLSDVFDGLLPCGLTCALWEGFAIPRSRAATIASRFR